MTPSALDADARIAEELRREFADSVPASVVRLFLDTVIADLRGSVSAEALPEMAVRLARVRLANRVDAARHRDFHPVVQGRPLLGQATAKRDGRARECMR